MGISGKQDKEVRMSHCLVMAEHYQTNNHVQRANFYYARELGVTR